MQILPRMICSHQFVGSNANVKCIRFCPTHSFQPSFFLSSIISQDLKKKKVLYNNNVILPISKKHNVGIIVISTNSCNSEGLRKSIGTPNKASKLFMQNCIVRVR